MIDLETVEDRLRRTFEYVGTNTTITSSPVPTIDNAPSAPRSVRRSRLAIAAVAVVAIATGSVFVATRPQHRVTVIEPAPTTETTSTTPSHALSCAQTGVSPDGATRGTFPLSGGSGEDRPDFIAVTSNQQIVGYMDIRGNPPATAPDVVYGCDLHTVVGHLVPNRGFVPVGIDPKTVPTIGDPDDLHRAEACIKQRKPIDCSLGG